MELKSGFSERAILNLGQYILDTMYAENTCREDMMKMLGCYILNMGGDLNMSPHEMHQFFNEMIEEYKIIRKARFG